MNPTREYVETPYVWARPRPPSWALEEVRTRRCLALAVDFIVIGLIFFLLFGAIAFLGVLTFGLAWLTIPILYPAIALIYNGVSISGWGMATPGMRAFGLEVRLTNGTRVPFLNAAAHALFFYFSWVLLTPLVLLVSFFADDKRCLHDILAGVVVTRRLD